jgi:hypothetical protein
MRLTISSGKSRDIHLREDLLTELEEEFFSIFLIVLDDFLDASWLDTSYLPRRSSRDFFAT